MVSVLLVSGMVKVYSDKHDPPRVNFGLNL